MTQDAQTGPDTSTGTLLNTKLLMISSALFMGSLGLIASLFPHEVLLAFDRSVDPFPVSLLSVTGALYFGFALVNWMAREKLIGGIYSRPVAIGNFVHFLAASLALAKQVSALPHQTPVLIGTVLYGLFAAAFGYIAFAGGRSCQ